MNKLKICIFAIMLSCANDRTTQHVKYSPAENYSEMGTSEEVQISKIELCQIPTVKIPNEEIAEKAVDLCTGSHFSDYEKYTNALTLLAVEDELSIPAKMKGMTLAAACIESKFKSSAKGDHNLSKDKKTAMAIGVLQMWPWYEKTYHVDRFDARSSATGWLTHIKRQVAPVKKLCKTTSTEDTWKKAWVAGVRSPKVGGRCNEVTKHWAFFKKLQRSIKNMGERT